MKRPRDDPPNKRFPPDVTDVSTKRLPAKRAKANQACTSCRKNKTRCELLEPTSYFSRCHRCNVLSIPCSFETNAPPVQLPDDSPHDVDRRRILSAVLSTSQHHFADKCLEQAQSILGSTPSSTFTSPWEFLKVPGIPDWAATPMLAMLTLSKMACDDQLVMQPMSNLTFADVLTGDQRHYLLCLFESHYAPWLSLHPNAFGEDPVLDLIRCTVASRYLEPSIRVSVFPTLRRLTEEAIMKHIFNPTPSPAIIQAFALLALWSPFDTSSPSSSSETHDSRLIAAAAINMCSSLRFDQAANDEQALKERRKSGEELTPQEATFLATVEQKKSLWMCIHNIEAMVCIGTGRGISSKSTAGKLRSLSPLNFSTLEDTRKTRMTLTAMIFDLTENGLRLEMSDDHGKFEPFCNELAEVLWRFDGLQRVVTSVHVVTDFEVFYAHMLIVNFYFCRLAFLVHTLRQMRMHIPPSVVARGGSMFFTSKVTRSGCGLALSCSRDALASAEALLATILSIRDKELLATAPDSVFAMISFAAAYITTSRFLILQSKAMRSLPGASEELLARMMKCLKQVSLSHDDNASRCARVISDFVDTWNKSQDTHDTVASGETPSGRSEASQAASSPSSTSKATYHGYADSQSAIAGPSPETTSSPEGLDYLFNLDQDALLGLDFWQYLAEMPSVQPDIHATYSQ